MLAAAAAGAIGGFIGHIAMRALRRVATGVIAEVSVKVQGGAKPVRAGQAGEAAVRAKYDIGKRERYNVEGRNRISDGTTNDTISEVKNVKQLSYTQQIKDIETHAAEDGKNIDLYVRGGGNPTALSPPLKAAIAANDKFNLKEIP